MSGLLNYDNIGIPICTNGAKTVYLFEKPVEDGVDRLVAKNGTMFQHAINKQTERQIAYVTGQSGSGKSYYTAQLAQEYHKAYPKRPVYVISYLDECSILDKLKFLKRIKIKNENFLTETIETADLKDSLVIFDDVDCIGDKKIKAKVFSLLRKVLETGRHANVSIVYTSHTSCNGQDTKAILNEYHSVTIYPRTCGGKTLKYLLENYFGLNKAEIETVKKLPSRFVTLMKTYPPVVFTQNEVYVR